MNLEDKKIQGIVNELISNSLNAKSPDIKVSIKNSSEKTEITVEDNGSGMDEATLEKVCLLLNQPHRDELEDYYGGLAGTSITGSGLKVVGILVDEAKVESKLDEGTTVTVIRYKK